MADFDVVDGEPGALETLAVRATARVIVGKLKHLLEPEQSAPESFAFVVAELEKLLEERRGS